MKRDQVLDFIVDGYCLVNRKCRVVDVNKAYCKISGFTREEIIGKSVRDLQISDSDEDIQERLEKLKISRYDHFESEVLSKNGEETFVM